MNPKPMLPAIRSDDEGALLVAMSPKYMRNAVAQAFEQLGGVQGLVEWAGTNLDTREKFYTKLAAKLIVKEVEISDKRSIDDIINELDGSPGPELAESPEMALDAEFEDVRDYD